MGKIVNATEENPINTSSKSGRIIPLTIPSLLQKKPHKFETINSCWRKPCPHGMRDFTGFTTEPIKEIRKEDCGYRKKKRKEKKKVGGGSGSVKHLKICILTNSRAN